MSKKRHSGWQRLKGVLSNTEVCPRCGLRKTRVPRPADKNLLDTAPDYEWRTKDGEVIWSLGKRIYSHTPRGCV
ncbi:MAG TPA: hypothetical protein VEL28_13025 [Candidatus Binatia bacterium]|nr:hypothetical protein [Candidatus Binatia bacterium]